MTKPKADGKASPLSHLLRLPANIWTNTERPLSHYTYTKRTLGNLIAYQEERSDGKHAKSLGVPC